MAGVGLLSPCTSPLPGGQGGDEDILSDSVVSFNKPFPPSSKAKLPVAPLFLHMAFRTVVEGKGDQSAFRRVVEEKPEQYTLPSNNNLPLCLSK